MGEEGGHTHSFLTGFSPVFMYNNEISDVISPAGMYELAHDVITTI